MRGIGDSAKVENDRPVVDEVGRDLSIADLPTGGRVDLSEIGAGCDDTTLEYGNVLVRILTDKLVQMIADPTDVAQVLLRW